MIWQSSSKISSWLPRLQCHRGYWVEGAQQNSLKAIQQAYEKKYEICEFDVRLTFDKKLILFHDAKHKSKFISDTDYNVLKQDIELTTLSQLFDWFSGTQDFKLNIEIKNDHVFNYEIEKQVCELVEGYKLNDRILISSFNPLSLAKVRYYNPKIFRALLLSFEKEHGNNWVVMSGIMNYLCYPHILHLRYEDYINKKIFFKHLAKKIPIVLWTVNEFRVYQENKELIYGIISDELTPEQMKESDSLNT